MNGLTNYDCETHEGVTRFHDEMSGLRAIIAIHSTALGPSFGGCRVWRYVSEAAALEDALRLSRGMSYKNAVAGLPFGGGKAVILGGAEKSEALLRAFGRYVNSLNGRYITAEDVGMTVADMQIVSKETAYVSGLRHDHPGLGGDPSPHTAHGVFLSIRAAVMHSLDRDDTLEGISIAVQGLGNVGYHLCRQLSAAGARLVVADVDQARVQRVCNEFGARPVSTEDILRQDVDVIAPCALGGVLNQKSIPELRTRIVAGAANNQLATAEDGTALHRLGILYAPDYVANAGGIISVAREYLDNSTLEELRAEVALIEPRLSEIFARSAQEDRSTAIIADEMAQRILTTTGGSASAVPPPVSARA